MQLPRIRKKSFHDWFLFAVLVLPWILTATGTAQSGKFSTVFESTHVNLNPALAVKQSGVVESQSQLKSAGGSFMLLGVSWSGDVYLVDPNSGVGTLIGPSGFDRLNAMDIDDLGRIIAARNDVEYLEIDPVTGLGTAIPLNPLNDPNSGNVSAMSFSSTNLLYFRTAGYDGAIWKASGPDLFEVFLLSIEPSQIIQAMAFAPDGTLYGWDVRVGLVTIDPNTGIWTDVTPGDSPPLVIQSITFGPDGVLYGINDELYTINTVDGSLTLIGSGGFSEIRGCVALLDSCDLNSPGSSDCNGNSIPDECDIATGFSIDCNTNGIPDECEITDYQLDDGSIEVFWTHFNLINEEWMNQYVVQAGQENITSITIVWPTAVPDGHPVFLRLFDDPNGDGDPTDRILLLEVASSSVASENPATVRVEVPPTFVGNAGESFFVAAYMPSVIGGTIASDRDAPLGKSWRVVNGGVPTLFPDDNFTLRADATHPSAIPDDCLARGDHNGDGVVSVLDLLNLLTNWGECPPGPELCLSDVDQDGAVTVSDLLTLLINWG